MTVPDWILRVKGVSTHNHWTRTMSEDVVADTAKKGST